MKAQLRSGDLLYRFGGDEFAALISSVRSRADATQIAMRLERCFGEPFIIQDIVLHGSVSVGVALYPEDGTTGDELLNSSDESMYMAKHRNKCAKQALEE
jgi:diguanylate cyclase (GGDEF)-like protein